MRKLLLITAIALGLSACASAPTVTKEDASAAIAAAEMETKRAAEVKYEWRDTGKLIKEAKEAMKKEDYATAQKLANKAARQSTLAIQQYHDQKNAGPAF